MSRTIAVRIVLVFSLLGMFCMSQPRVALEVSTSGQATVLKAE